MVQVSDKRKDYLKKKKERNSSCRSNNSQHHVCLLPDRYNIKTSLHGRPRPHGLILWYMYVDARQVALSWCVQSTVTGWIITVWKWNVRRKYKMTLKRKMGMIVCFMLVCLKINKGIRHIFFSGARHLVRHGGWRTVTVDLEAVEICNRLDFQNGESYTIRICTRGANLHAGRQ